MRLLIKIKMKRPDACSNILMVIIGLTLCTVVFSNTRFSFFRVANFLNGNIIATKGSITSVLACFRTCGHCGDTCGYVQYRADGTCVFYSEAVLLTEPAVVEGQIQGYRKVSGIHVFSMYVCSEPDIHTPRIS